MEDKVAAIVEAWFPGEGGGRAIANVLFGKVNPSGKLPLTFPARDQDTPTWRRDGALVQDPVYSEKLDIGYRWYDATKIAPSFEFGFGLSYIPFSYFDLFVETNAANSMSVAFSVRNDGATVGAEVPQVYLGIKDKDEPPRRLVGWNKITLKPGETQRVLVNISPRRQSVWDTNRNEWRFVADSAVFVGASSRDIRLSTK